MVRAAGGGHEIWKAVRGNDRCGHCLLILPCQKRKSLRSVRLSGYGCLRGGIRAFWRRAACPQRCQQLRYRAGSDDGACLDRCKLPQCPGRLPDGLERWDRSATRPGTPPLFFDRKEIDRLNMVAHTAVRALEARAARLEKLIINQNLIEGFGKRNPFSLARWVTRVCTVSQACSAD